MTTSNHVVTFVPTGKRQVDELLAELIGASRRQGKYIRRKLRRYGHYGGITIQRPEEATEAKTA